MDGNHYPCCPSPQWFGLTIHHTQEQDKDTWKIIVLHWSINYILITADWLIWYKGFFFRTVNTVDLKLQTNKIWYWKISALPSWVTWEVLQDLYALSQCRHHSRPRYMIPSDNIYLYTRFVYYKGIKSKIWWKITFREGSRFFWRTKRDKEGQKDVQKIENPREKVFFIFYRVSYTNRVSR